MTRTIIEIEDFTDNYRKPLKIHTNYKHKRHPEKISIVLANYYDSQDKKQLVVKNKEQLTNFLNDLSDKYGVEVVEYENTKYKLLPTTPTVRVRKPLDFPKANFDVEFL